MSRELVVPHQGLRVWTSPTTGLIHTVACGRVESGPSMLIPGYLPLSCVVRPESGRAKEPLYR